MSRGEPPQRIALILPAYNEAKRITQTIETVAAYRTGGGQVAPIYLADDGSTDGTIDVARAAARRVALPLEILSMPHRGKAWTVRTAMLHAARHADVEYLMMLDADDELRIDQLDHVNWTSDPRTVYIGRRVAAVGPATTPIRRLMSRTMRVGCRLLLGMDFRDTQCGFKLFPREVAADLFGQQRSRGWTFDAELLLIAHRLSGIPVQEVDVVWSPRGVSKVGPAAAVSSAVALLGTAFNRARGVYRPVGRQPLTDTDAPRRAVTTARAAPVRLPDAPVESGGDPRAR